MGVRLLVAALLVVSLASSSWATSLSDFAVFGGGNVFIWEGSTVNGQVGSNGPVFAQDSTLNGPVVGGGVFTSGGGNRILGDMRFNGGVTLGPGDVVTGDIYPTDPPPYPPGNSPVVLPPTMYPVTLPITSGSLYNATVYLSAGERRRYDSITGTLDLYLRPSLDSIDVYVDGGVSISNVTVWVWDGTQYVSYAQAVADPALRAMVQNVYFETGQDWYIGSGEWFGLIYAPNGRASIGPGPGSDTVGAVGITGAVWAGKDVYLSQVNAIPEPITAVGLVLGGLAVLVRCKRK
jgi:hypothetical protein